MKLSQRWKQTTAANKAMVYTTAIVALGTLFYAGTALWQVYILNKSAKQAGEQTDRLIAANEQMANATVEALKEAKRQNEEAANRAERATVATESAAGSMATQANVSSKMAASGASMADTAQKSIKIAQDSLAVSQRPWVLFQDIADTHALDPTGRISLTVVIQNYGNSPALGVTATANVRYDTKTPEAMTSEQLKAHDDSPTDVGPKRVVTVPVSGTLTPDNLARVHREHQILYIWGRIEYGDIFGQLHFTTFCGQQSYGKPDLYACKKGNAAN